MAVQEAKVKLDMTVSPGVWLMPSNMIINTETVLGYNNKLLMATNDMKFGINDSINIKTKVVGIHHNMGDSKIKLPHQVTDSKDGVTPVKSVKPKKTSEKPTSKPIPSSKTHETNLTAITVGAAGLAWYMFR